MDLSKNFYLDLEQGLHGLVVHFDMLQDAKDAEVLDWARFFMKWSETAARLCGSWSRENMYLAEKIVRNLKESKTGVMGYEALKTAMSEASRNLTREIQETLKKGNG